MRKILLVFTLLCLAFIGKAQSPDSINYQAIARNSAGAELGNKNISVKFILHQGSANGPHLMVDVHPLITTNAFGLFSTYIGSGTDSSSIAAINWGLSGAIFLEVDIDTTASASNWINM